MIQKGIKPTRLGELKLPNGRKCDINYKDFIHDFGKGLKKKSSYVLPQHKIRDFITILKQNKFPTSYIKNKEIRKQLGSIRSSSSETENITLPSMSSHPICTCFSESDEETRKQRLLTYYQLKRYKKNL